ncbi:TIGR01212 family radical SAM protein [Candidatus Soleaferrea massiliensis]|uniref:TIGR01212 family radical SAM protein n=1 Tax=Candidatus Soleaferrea massiliensis TaxID=1470354 RepID=UPI00058D2211|nr:TIGR01212 family radical SAM protein [Candidatus Soleaferrea massiliensis]
MDNPFPYTDSNKRYHTLNYHLRQTFGCKVFKVSLNAGFTCPNRDGTRGIGGCIFCSEAGSGDFAGNPAEDLYSQFCKVKEQLHHKWPRAKYVAYFQAYTNTYAPIDVLREKYEAALRFDGVVGLSIATRPDAISDETLDYLADLHQRTYLVVELGLQTAHDQTGRLINRCFDYAEFERTFRKLKELGVRVCVHLINGLPGEDREMMLETVRRVAALGPHSVKLHLLHVLRGTQLEKLYEDGAFRLLELEEYVDIVCSQLELLPAAAVIGRVTGDGAKEQLVGPMWSLKKFVVMNEIDKELLRRNSYQGRLAKGDAG